MNLYEEEFEVKKSDNSKKITTIILVIIILLLFVVAGLIGAIYYLKQNTMSLTLNGSSSSELLNMLVIDDSSSAKIYVPIKDVAKYLGYEAYNGNYTTKSEDSSQCYVQCDEEVAMFTLNSDLVYKKITTKSDDYEYFQIDEAVKAIDGKLYTTMDGIEKAFNVSFNYDEANKKITIYTMPYLINYYSTRIINYGYASVSTDFNNEKAVLENMLIVQNEKGKVGVLDLSTKEAVLEAKYDSIEYLQHTSDFLVTDSKKAGIISSTKKTKIAIQYDSIELMDNERTLYKVKQNSKYGVINSTTGNIVVSIDYDDIGIDASKFEENNIKNSYIIADKLIPVKQNNLWGFLDLNGNKVTECKYASLGYIVANNKVGYSLLVVPDYNVIVVGNGSKYNIITANGEEVWNFYPFDSVYLTLENGEYKYNMTYNSETLNLCDYLDKMGYGTNK